MRHTTALPLWRSWRREQLRESFLVIIGLIALFSPVSAISGELSVGLLLYSHHHNEDTFKCGEAQLLLNEDNSGLYIVFPNGLMLGRYENSVSGCKGAKYSTLLGYETRLNDYWSVTAGIANGYVNATGYVPWATVNLEVGIFKIWYGYTVTGLGLEWDFE